MLCYAYYSIPSTLHKEAVPEIFDECKDQLAIDR